MVPHFLRPYAWPLVYTNTYRTESACMEREWETAHIHSDIIFFPKSQKRFFVIFISYSWLLKSDRRLQYIDAHVSRMNNFRAHCDWLKMEFQTIAMKYMYMAFPIFKTMQWAWKVMNGSPSAAQYDLK